MIDAMMSLRALAEKSADGDVPATMGFPVAHRPKLHSTHPLARFG